MSVTLKREYDGLVATKFDSGPDGTCDLRLVVEPTANDSGRDEMGGYDDIDGLDLGPVPEKHSGKLLSAWDLMPYGVTILIVLGVVVTSESPVQSKPESPSPRKKLTRRHST